MPSCTHYYYGPNSANLVLLNEKELKINGGFAASDEFNAFEVQSAIAVTPRFAIMANGIIGGGQEDEELSEGNDSGSAQYGEVGIGYFKPLESETYRFEIFGGLGFGGVENNYDINEASKVTFSKYFIQPGFGFRDDHFEWGFASRFSYVQHKLVSSNVTTTNNPEDFEDILQLGEEPNSFLWEPGFVFRFGGPKIKGQIQYTYSLNLTNPQLQQERGILNAGISIPVSLNARS